MAPEKSSLFTHAFEVISFCLLSNIYYKQAFDQLNYYNLYYKIVYSIKNWYWLNTNFVIFKLLTRNIENIENTSTIQLPIHYNRVHNKLTHVCLFVQIMLCSWLTLQLWLV